MHCAPNIIWVIKSRKMRFAGHVARLQEGECAYRVLVGKLEGKRPLGRSRLRFEDNNKVDLREVGCGGMNWIDPVRNRDRRRALVNAVMNFRVP